MNNSCGEGVYCRYQLTIFVYLSYDIYTGLVMHSLPLHNPAVKA